MAGSVIASITPTNVYSPGQISLIKATVAKDCNTAEFDLFVSVCMTARLDPLRKQIYALVHNKGDEAKRKLTIITGIDGMRSIAARSGRYRPDEDEPDFTYDETLRGPANPLGLVKARVRLWVADVVHEGGWKPVTGVAYWDEFAPLKEEVEGGFDWVETGDFHADSGKPKKRKVPRVEGSAVIKQLDTSGQWGKMGRLMLAKCAEAQALRKAFPEDMSGLYETSEMDQTNILDLSPSEYAERHAVDERLKRIGAAGAIMFQLSPMSSIEPIALGKVADKLLEAAKAFESPKALEWFMDANREPLKEFWARAKDDALGVKKVLEATLIELRRAEAA